MVGGDALKAIVDLVTTPVLHHPRMSEQVPLPYEAVKPNDLSETIPVSFGSGKPDDLFATMLSATRSGHGIPAGGTEQAELNQLHQVEHIEGHGFPNSLQGWEMALFGRKLRLSSWWCASCATCSASRMLELQMAAEGITAAS